MSWLTLQADHSRQQGQLEIMTSLMDEQFLTKFNSDFPLTKGSSWKMFRPANKLSSLICSLLQGETPPLGSLLRLPRNNSAIGDFGNGTAASLEWTHTSKESSSLTNLLSSNVIPEAFGKALLAEDVKSEWAQLKKRLAPSARNSVWLENQIPPRSRLT